ncbi:basic helix-loop-helix (bHLH) DNA-binding superfamily protein [Actinidia rufa]|uniref:Basic helix-loop-helix (BHLH) DNA-binding superfamily protein n=1 Tax=Actinidia rufa TaxID=165716 RepID=A0A7J0EQP0_9ERIC|nr:basic helix-loop-helix (bHLH) DNA-binding superfamily protein [Actinidia rufa]
MTTFASISTTNRAEWLGLLSPHISACKAGVWTYGASETLNPFLMRKPIALRGSVETIKRQSDDFSHPLHNSHPEPRQRHEGEVKDPMAARKFQKADREKLRRDRLNEQFLELGNALDPDRPKNDKATILTDTIQVLKDLTAEVNRLKAECTSLSEESREVPICLWLMLKVLKTFICLAHYSVLFSKQLTQEKNELREEKASLKSDIDNLNLQYQQRIRAVFPWAAIDPSVVMTTPPYSYPVPLISPIPMHPTLQPFPFFGNHNPGAIHNPCSTYIPYPAPASHQSDQQSHQCASTSRIPSKPDPKSKKLDRCMGSNGDKCDESNDVVTDLELKMPGSTAQKKLSLGERKGKKTQRKDKSIVDGSSSSRHSSSPDFQDSSNSTQNHEVSPKS